ncbi:MAG: UDP-N-acetylglucosamine 2-epimerase [Candidatus Omnitrophota bacterium]
MKKKICAITGSRADYGIYHPVFRAIKGSRHLELYIVATCMHLMREFGYTAREIEKDGFRIYRKADISYGEDTAVAMSVSVGKAVILLSKIFAELRPDVVMVLGDRGEMLSGAIAANYLNIPVAHIHGGEVSGHVDGLLRHAITKLAHIHLAPTKGSGERIIRMGEEPWRVHVVGAPALDRIINGRFSPRAKLIKRYKIDPTSPLILAVQHPVSTEIGKAASHMKIMLDAVRETGVQTIVAYPNADAGGRRMIEVIRSYKRYPFIKAFKSIPHEDYLGLMKIASVLVGNSSSGIIEAPSFGLPVVNIGARQHGRERSPNIIDVRCVKGEIVNAVKKAMSDSAFRKGAARHRNLYGDGNAAKRIVSLLEDIKIGDRLLHKRITY